MADPTMTADDAGVDAVRRERALALHAGMVALLRDADAEGLDAETRDRLRRHAAVLSAWFDDLTPPLLDADTGRQS